MKQLGEGLFEVPSDSDYSRTYVVNLTGDYGQCTCTAWAIKRNKNKSRGLPPGDCKHITAVKRMNPAAFAAQKEAEVKAQAKAEAEAKARAEAERKKMGAELAKMRADLAGEPAPKAPTPATTVSKAKVTETAAKPAESGNDLLAELEAQIAARKGQ